MLDHFFSLLLPKDFESLKILDIRLWEVGAKRPLNGTSKVNRHTDGHTDRRTFRLIESIGPEGQCFENCWCFDMFYYPTFFIHQHFQKDAIDFDTFFLKSLQK